MKKDHVGVPEPSSKFYRVVCRECEETQIIYSHASTKISCNSCGNTISEPTGSKAEIYGNISESAE